LRGPHFDMYWLTVDIKLVRISTLKTLHFHHMMQSVNKCFKDLYLETVNPVPYMSFIDS